MAADTIKFSELSAVSVVDQSSIFPIVQNGENVIASLSAIGASLSLGSMSIQDSTDVSITGGTANFSSLSSILLTTTTINTQVLSASNYVDTDILYVNSLASFSTDCVFTYSGASLDTHRNSLLLGSSVRVPAIEDISTSTRTLSGSDYGKKLRFGNAGGCDITIPDGIGSSGEYFILRRLNTAGPLTLTLGGSVTVDGAAKISEVNPGNECAIMATGTNTYDLV
jgi:hypothetical protein